jgi:tRNA-specific adenosine deaminase 1
MKCLPQKSIPQAQGIVIHDWHAEILALRTFNEFLLQECRGLINHGEAQSRYLRRRSTAEITDDTPQPFALRDDIELHMYCSEAPCT